jgi:hypothetical protein
MVYATDTMVVGLNHCAWLVLSSTELCGRQCVGEHCKVHLARLRKGSCTRPCRVCGVGVTNKISLCVRCGYKNEVTKLWHRDQRAAEKEFARLAAIDISI